MKVALISTGKPIAAGGGNSSTKIIVDELRKRGCNVDVFVTSNEVKTIKKCDDSVFEIPQTASQYLPDRISSNIGVFRHLPSLDEYDIVHAYGPTRIPGITSRRLLTCDETPVIGTANNLSWVCTNWVRYLKNNCPNFGTKELVSYSYNQGYKIRLPLKVTVELVGKTLTNLSDHITVQTSGMADILSNCGFSTNKISVVPNVLDTRFDITSTNPNRTVVFAGRLIERKGVRDILNAFINVEPTLSEDWELKIYGDGPLKNELIHPIKNKENVSVNYCPYKELPKVYRNASVLVHGSKYPEPFSRTWLEAMASETAIVASENPSSRAVLSDFAELYDPFDQEDLRSSLRSVLENKSKRDRMKTQGKKQIDQYRPENIISEYINIYEKML